MLSRCIQDAKRSFAHKFRPKLQLGTEIGGEMVPSQAADRDGDWGVRWFCRGLQTGTEIGGEMVLSRAADRDGDGG